MLSQFSRTIFMTWFRPHDFAHNDIFHGGTFEWNVSFSGPVLCDLHENCCSCISVYALLLVFIFTSCFFEKPDFWVLGLFHAMFSVPLMRLRKKKLLVNFCSWHVSFITSRLFLRWFLFIPCFLWWWCWWWWWRWWWSFLSHVHFRDFGVLGLFYWKGPFAPM